MLDPFVTLQEAGFSQRNRGEPSRLEGWSAELITSLDWVRLSEVARSVVAEAGCELAGAIVRQDGSVMFGMIECPKTARPQRALVKITPWNEWGATAETVQRFAQEITTAKNARGILIAPAGFSTAAMHAAQAHQIEAVDASGMLAVLQALPVEKSDFLFHIATAGDYTTPSCPVCKKKLQRIDQETLTLLSRTIDTNGLIAETVVCDSLIIAPGCEVTFLHEVRARSIHVQGRAEGDFLCHGPVTLHAGGTLSGSVAASSLNVRDGGQLLGQFRILEGKPESFIKEVRRWHWCCRGEEGENACASVLFEPHE